MLTREEIEKLPAGRPLDELVVEHIMQWERSPHNDGYWRDTSRKRRFYVPNFSTEWEHAGKVVEAMQEWEYWLKLHSPFEPGYKYFASFDQHGCTDTRPMWEAAGETGPLAICRSALLAILAYKAEKDAPTPTGNNPLI